VQEYEDPRTGEIKKRYLNKSRWMGFGPTVIGHLTPLGEVPVEPVLGVRQKLSRMNEKLLDKLKKVRGSCNRESYSATYMDVDVDVDADE
jgi:hypothetical protein